VLIKTPSIQFSNGLIKPQKQQRVPWTPFSPSYTTPRCRIPPHGSLLRRQSQGCDSTRCRGCQTYITDAYER